MSIKDKILAGFLVTLWFIFTFAGPIIAAYFFLAEDVTTAASTHKSGALFFTIVTVFAGSGIIFLMKWINKLKANIFKTLFKLAIRLAIISFVIIMCKYVSFNLLDLVTVLKITLGCFVVGSVFEVIAVESEKTKPIIREWGVF